jgi:hypothetical protein
MLWKGRLAKKQWPGEESDYPDPPSDVALWLFVVAILLSFWGIVQASRTFQAWVLCVEAAGIGLILVILARVCVGSRRKNHLTRGAPAVLISIAVVLITMTAAFYSNCRLPSREARTERLSILGKRCTYKKGRRNACLLTVLADGHTESIYVSGSEWDRAQVGGVYSTTVWTGYWGFRYIGLPADRR